MKAKILQKKDDNKPSAFEHDISLKDAKSLKVELSSFVYNDFNPDSDEYEVTEITVKKSTGKIKFTESKGKMMVVLESADVELSFDDGDQEERFLDKDWSEEWVEPTICFKGSKDGDEIYLPYEDNSLFTIDL